MKYIEGKYYHLFNRGCNKELIFIDDADYMKLINIIENSEHESYVEIYAFALMPNHYHLLVKQTGSRPLSNWLKWIFNRYSQYFNKRHCRSGTLFEGRVKSRLIDTDDYLLKIIDYIHENPETEKQLQYSSLNYLLNDSFVNENFYIKHFGSVEEFLEMNKNT